MIAGFVARALSVAGWFLSLAAAEAALAAVPFSFDSAPGRLPKTVVPIDYTISIVPDAAARTVNGEESVNLQFREAADTIQFNSVGQNLSAVQLDGRPVKDVVTDGARQLVTVALDKPAVAGRHQLTLEFQGKIDSNPPGFFEQEFVKPGGGNGILLSTKFEPTYARRMFPCWDEPAFRSTFQLSVTVPSGWATVANMPIASRSEHGALATTTFKRSPRMPSYLVELSAGDLAQIAAVVASTKLGVWAVRGQEQDGAIALANAKQILLDYNDYFGYPYPLPKLDSIAIPGGFAGAMENWGAITYNDQSLLLTALSTLGDRQTVYSTQAHEMAHQWNGDLVTMGWWDDLWLNESFASWMSAKETDFRNPTWNWWEKLDATKERAMRADSQLKSHSIEQHVSDELQAQTAFDPAITYLKGQAVLRMFEAYLGPGTFRDGIRRYIKAHAFSNTSSADLWNSLSAASGRPLAPFAAAWTEQAGFPLVEVGASCAADGRRTVTLTQRRFLLQGSDPEHRHWDIPLQIRSGTSVAQNVLLTHDGQSITAGRCDETLSANAGDVGFYRTAYDDATLQANISAFATMPPTDRVALLDDQWALAEADAKQLPNYLALVRAMGPDLNERAWNQITQALAAIEYDERGTAGHDAFTAFASSIIRPVADRLGWQEMPGESPGLQQLRRTILRDLGAWADPQVVAEARQRFARFVLDRSAILPDDQNVVLFVVARNADAAAFEQLHTVAKSAANETELRRYYTALMDVRDPQLAALAAKIAVSTEIPPQAGAHRLTLLVELSQNNPQLSWATFAENADLIIRPREPYGALTIAKNIPEYFWDSLPPDQLEKWVRAHTPAGMDTTITQAMDDARFRLSEKTVLTQAADRYLASLH
ncbi:MAG TPA: M1 family metallopeptidase [Steroidobacteraceae bacterium]